MTLDRTIQEKESQLSIMRNAIKKAEDGNKIKLTLKEAARNGTIQGFHGRLGDLGTIPAEYDVAISTACGNLESMIVDNVTSAEKCIAYLRETKAGRANFICLDRVSQQLAG